MFKNPRRSRQARNFTENDPKILDLKSSSEQIIFRKLSLGAPVLSAAVVMTELMTATLQWVMESLMKTFPIVHRTFLLSYFRGCWLLDFSCARMWTHNEAFIELAAAVFCKRLQEHQAMSFVTKLNSWRRKQYKIRLDSFLYLCGFTAKINKTVCSSRLFSTDLERHLSTS